MPAIRYPAPAPAPLDVLPDLVEVSSGRRVFWLLGLVLTGLVLVLGLQIRSSAQIRELDAKAANERVRLFIGEEISRGIQDIEKEVYRLATTTGVKGQQLVEKRVLDRLDKLRNDLLVLKQGGTVRQVVDLNLQLQDQMIRQVDYRPTVQASAYVLELIELGPLLDEIDGKVRQLRAQIAQRDAYQAAGKVPRQFPGAGEINLFLKQVPPLFLRLTENANRLLYENRNRQAELDAQLLARQSDLEHTEQVLLVLVMLSIVLPAFLYWRRINAANQKLRLTWQEMRQAKTEAERANRAKSEFLSRMSHELRTPLNAILGFGQLMSREKLEADQADSVREILQAGQHLLELINEVLDLARIESGKFTVSLEPVALGPLVEDCLALVRPQAEARAIRMTEPGLGCVDSVQADRTRLKQVLLNLLSNAVKYNREGGEIGVQCELQGENVRIRISDTGAGLTAEQQARLFVPFERLDADQGAIEGTGIGLALSKRLVEHMQGQIGLESTPGTGSSFWVQLPLADGAGQANGPAVLAAEVQADNPVGHAMWDVLCIEDNPANLRLIERILARRADIRLRTASTPGLGLELARAHRPALILLDINLPGMDGYAVLQSLRENEATRGIPVVAISANAMPKDLARGRAAGFANYVTKPLDVARLLAVVEDTLGALAKPADTEP